MVTIFLCILSFENYKSLSLSLLNWLKIYYKLNQLFSLVSINSYIIIGLLLLILLLFYIAINKTLQKKLNLNKNYSEFEPKEEQFRIYFLFFGITIPLIETIVDVFELRRGNHMAINYTAGILLLLFYLLSNKSSFFHKYINHIFRVSFFAYFAFIIYNVFFEPFELLSYIAIIITFFLSYFVIKNIIQYWIFVSCVFSILIFSYQNQLIEHKLTMLLVCAFISIVAIHIEKTQLTNIQYWIMFLITK